MVHLAGLKISESVKVPMKKMTVKVHQMEKNQTVKNQKTKKMMAKVHQTVRNQTVRNQKTKKIMKMMKKNQKTARKTKNQKVQHQLAKLVNGKNVKNSWELWEVLLNVLLIPVSSPAMMVPKLLMDHLRPNVSKVLLNVLL